jgi:hypothetical protein
MFGSFRSLYKIRDDMKRSYNKISDGTKKTKSKINIKTRLHTPRHGSTRPLKVRTTNLCEQQVPSQILQSLTTPT